MPLADLIYGRDIAKKPECNCNGGDNMSDNKSCNCEHEAGYPWIVPPPMPIPPGPDCHPHWPWPPYPPCPHPVPPIDPDEDPKKGSAEQKICKYSRKAAAIEKMIINLETKKKDFIIKAGEVSYNFGNIDLEVEGWEDESYAATALKILKFELSLIKAKIAELAAEIGEEADTDNSGTEGTVAGDG